MSDSNSLLTLRFQSILCQDQLVFSSLIKHLSHKQQKHISVMLICTTVSSTPESGHYARVWIHPLMGFDKSILQFNECVIKCFCLPAGWGDCNEMRLVCH